MTRILCSLTALLFGSGILVLAVGIFGNTYSWTLGIVGLVTLWVVAFTLRVFTITRDEELS